MKLTPGEIFFMFPQSYFEFETHALNNKAFLRKNDSTTRKGLIQQRINPTNCLKMKINNKNVGNKD